MHVKGKRTHNYDETDKLCVCSLSTLPGNDVPLLRSTDNYLSGCNLFLVQLVITSQFIHSDVVRTESLHQEV